MTRATEFCYLAETRNGDMIQAMLPGAEGQPVLWTNDPEQAARFTFDGIRSLQRVMGASIGFRKVLAG